MIPLSDRRQDERFDVVGSMWGVLELNEPARIENVGLTGALVDSPVPAALGSTHLLHLVVDGQDVKVEGLVRHVRSSAQGGHAERFLIGVEFTSPPLHVVQAIEQLGAEQGQDPPHIVTGDRRRVPRYQVSGGELALLLSPMSVQILDISRGGVLLQSSHEARPEGTGRLTTTLKGQPFSAELEVRRVEVLPAGGYRIGAKFTVIGQEHRRVLEEFTHRGPA